jgi:hypothetical protein
MPQPDSKTVTSVTYRNVQICLSSINLWRPMICAMQKAQHRKRIAARGKLSCDRPRGQCLHTLLDPA